MQALNGAGRASSLHVPYPVQRGLMMHHVMWRFQTTCGYADDVDGINAHIAKVIGGRWRHFPPPAGPLRAEPVDPLVDLAALVVKQRRPGESASSARDVR